MTWTIKIQMINPQGNTVTEDIFEVQSEVEAASLCTKACITISTQGNEPA